MSKNNFVSNIGGVFIYSKNPERLAEWYNIHLLIDFEKTGKDSPYCYKSFYYKDSDNGIKYYIAWAIMKMKDTDETSNKSFCINYRVNDLSEVVKHLRSLKVPVKEIEIYPEGKFVWINDIDGNKIELWEDTSVSAE